MLDLLSRSGGPSFKVPANLASFRYDGPLERIANMAAASVKILGDNGIQYNAPTLISSGKTISSAVLPGASTMYAGVTSWCGLGWYFCGQIRFMPVNIVNRVTVAITGAGLPFKADGMMTTGESVFGTNATTQVTSRVCGVVHAPNFQLYKPVSGQKDLPIPASWPAAQVYDPGTTFSALHTPEVRMIGSPDATGKWVKNTELFTFEGAKIAGVISSRQGTAVLPIGGIWMSGTWYYVDERVAFV